MRTKFSPGNKVWTILEDKVIHAEIFEIRISHQRDVQYEFRNTKKNYLKQENEVFETKDQLIKSL